VEKEYLKEDVNPMFEIKVTVEAPEITQTLQNLISLMIGQRPAEPMKAEPVPKVEAAKDPAQEVKTAPEKTVTLEQVRAKLASLSQAGKQVQVKELITSFGAKKLTEIPAEKYAEVLVKAEEL
jgi:hypothetical protein